MYDQKMVNAYLAELNKHLAPVAVAKQVYYCHVGTPMFELTLANTIFITPVHLEPTQELRKLIADLCVVHCKDREPDFNNTNLFWLNIK